jgi:hypothetical protein
MNLPKASQTAVASYFIDLSHPWKPENPLILLFYFPLTLTDFLRILREVPTEFMVRKSEK